MKKPLKTKSTNSLKTDSEERFAFGPWNYLTKKEIGRVYAWRRKSLLQGHCIRCAKELTKSLYCNVCNTDMKEFCFESDLKDRDKAIKDHIKIIKFAKYKF